MIEFVWLLGAVVMYFVGAVEYWLEEGFQMRFLDIWYWPGIKFIDKIVDDSR